MSLRDFERRLLQIENTLIYLELAGQSKVHYSSVFKSIDENRAK